MTTIKLFFNPRKQLLFSLVMLFLLTLLFFSIKTFAQTSSAAPCNATRWDDGDGWRLVGSEWTIEANPNSLPKGIVPCDPAGGASTEGMLQNFVHPYDPSAFTISGDQGSPNPGDDVVWLNFDIRAYAGTFEYQLLTGGGSTGELKWALYYSNAFTPGLGGNGLSGDCSDLQSTPTSTGIVDNGWLPLTVPKFSKPTNYYVAVWSSTGGTLDKNVIFKAREGCGQVPITCIIEKSGAASLTCNSDGTYTVCQDIDGANGIWNVVDNAATKATSYDVKTYLADGVTQVDHFTSTDLTSNPISITFGNLGNGGAVRATVCVTYATGNSYDITLSAQGLNPAPANYTCTNGDISFSGTGLSSVAKPAATVDPPTCITSTGTVHVTNPVDGTTYTLTDKSDASKVYAAVGGVFNNVPPGTYTLNAAADGECDTKGDDVKVNDAPTTLTKPAATVVDPTCTVATGTVNVTNPMPGVTYTLTDKSDATKTFTADAEGKFTNVPSGTYSFSASNGSCSADGDDVVVANQPASPTVTANDTHVCSGSSVSLTGSPDGGIWSGNHVTGSTFDATGLLAGPYIVTYTYTNGDGCKGSDDATVTVNALPTVSASSDVSICSGGSTTLTASGATSYSWLPSTGLSATIGASVTANPTSTTTYTVTGTDGNTCSNTAQVKVTVNPVPSCTISNTTSSGSHTAGVGQAVKFSGPSGAGYAYVWGFSSNTAGAAFSGGITNTQTVTVTTTTTGSYTLSLKVIDNSYATNCNSTCTYAVTVNTSNAYYTVTQGFYGNVGGKICTPSGSLFTTGTKGNVDGLIAVSIKNMLNQTLLLGITGNNRTFKMTATTTEEKNLILYLPAGQAATLITPNSGSNNNTNITTNLPKLNSKKISDVLLGQTITLALNVSIPQNPLGSFGLKTGYLTTQKSDLTACPVKKVVSCTSDATSISSLQLTPNAALMTYLNGKTVNDLLALASSVLGGGSLPAGVTLSDVNNAVDVINRSFDGGRFFLGYFNSAQSCSAPLSITSNVSITDQNVTKLAVTAYPNPFTDKVKFSIVSPVSGKACLDIYNIMGQKLHTVYQGYLFAGRGQVVEYNVPSSIYKSTLIYTLQVGDKQVNGKLVQLR